MTPSAWSLDQLLSLAFRNRSEQLEFSTTTKFLVIDWAWVRYDEPGKLDRRTDEQSLESACALKRLCSLAEFKMVVDDPEFEIYIIFGYLYVCRVWMHPFDQSSHRPIHEHLVQTPV